MKYVKISAFSLKLFDIFFYNLIEKHIFFIIVTILTFQFTYCHCRKCLRWNIFAFVAVSKECILEHLHRHLVVWDEHI